MKIAIVLFALFFLSVGRVSAQTEMPVPTEEVSPTPSPTPEVLNYPLPYPGILPGTPLYTLKAARDRIIDFFITDPLKKSNYYLLQADKRLASSIALFGQGEEKLGETTLSKGQNYLEKSFDKALEAEKRQLGIEEVLPKIELSARKHREEITKLINVSKRETKQKLETDLKRAQEFEKKVTSNRSQR